MSPQLKSLEITREPIAQMVYATVRDAIVDKVLAPGALISEVSLARDLNVSKTPVREALLRLREIRLVEVDANRRLRVIRPSLSAITAAYELRLILESGAAALAAARASDQQCKELKRAAEQSVSFAEARDPDQFRHWDGIFHTAIAESASSPHLTRLVKDGLLLTDTLRTRDVPMAGDSIACSHEHLQIAEAIMSKDANSAGQLAADHIEHVSLNVLSALQSTVKATVEST